MQRPARLSPLRFAAAPWITPNVGPGGKFQYGHQHFGGRICRTAFPGTDTRSSVRLAVRPAQKMGNSDRGCRVARLFSLRAHDENGVFQSTRPVRHTSRSPADLFRSAPAVTVGCRHLYQGWTNHETHLNWFTSISIRNQIIEIGEGTCAVDSLFVDGNISPPFHRGEWAQRKGW